MRWCLVLGCVLAGCGRIEFDAPTCTETPPGCTRIARGSHAYLFCLEKLTFDEADTVCASAGCSLAAIDAAGENAWVFEQAQDVGITGSAWLGGDDRTLTSQFVWRDGRVFWSDGPVSGRYANWGSNEPNDTGGTEACVELRIDQLNEIVPGAWNDVPCENPHTFVCR